MTAVDAIPKKPPQSIRLLGIPEVATRLGVSESWVRRHIAELPAARFGRLILVDSSLLSEYIHSRIQRENSLKPERAYMPSRYQRGSVFRRGKDKVWYGKFREDVRTPAGIERRQRLLRLGSVAELPTKNAARDKLAEMMSRQEERPLAMDITFGALTDRWQQAEGPTMKASTLNHYGNALRAYVLPAFGNRKIVEITREDIQRFLADNAKDYSTSTLRSTRVVLGLTLRWAVNCGWLEKNPCERIKLPKVTGGRTVVRASLTAEQVNAIAAKLHEPYATLVLFLYASGLRVGEGIAVKLTDFEGNVLTVSRRIYDGDVDIVKSLKSQRKLQLAPWLVERLRALGPGEWVFRSKAGTPVNPGNALRRYVRPAATACRIKIGGWHDLRHSLTTKMRKSGVHPKVVSDILGHSRVNLAMDVYDRTDVQDLGQPLAAIANELVSNGIKSEVAA